MSQGGRATRDGEGVMDYREANVSCAGLRPKSRVAAVGLFVDSGRRGGGDRTGPWGKTSSVFENGGRSSGTTGVGDLV